MKTNDFDELLASEAGRITWGQLSPSRRFTFAPMDIKKIRRTLNVTQTAFSRMNRLVKMAGLQVLIIGLF